MASNALDLGNAQTGPAMSRPVLSGTNVQGAGAPIIARVDQQGQAQGARTMDAMMKLGSEALASRVKEASQEQYLQGMQQAAAGQGLQEILKEQPWYTEIFGKSSASMGARAYTTQAAMAQFGADMEKAMPELAKQGPEALMTAAQGFLKNVMTGDTLVDSTLMSGFADQLQPLFKRHAKENYIYTQNQANAAQVTAMDSMFDAYQQRAKAATQKESGVSADDVFQDGTRLLGSLAPFPGQSDESYQKNILSAVTGAARKGNFQAIKLLEDQGVFKALPPEHQAQLQNTLRTAGREALNNAMPEYAMDVAMFVNDTAQDPRGVVERMRKLNEKAAAATGVSLEHAQLIPSSYAENIVGNVLRAQASALASQKDDGQALAFATSQLMIPGAISKAKALKGVTGVSDAVAEQAAASAWVNNPDPRARAALLNANPSGTYDYAKADLKAMGIGSADKQDTKGVQQVAATYSNLTDEVRGAYFSSDEQQFYDRYLRSVNAGVPPEQAFLSAKIAVPLGKYQLDKNDKAELHKAIRAEAENRNENMLGWNTVDDQSLRVIEAYIGKDYATNRGLNDMKTSVARSLTTALSNGLQIVGKHAIVGGQPGQQSLVSYMSTGTNNAGAKETASRFESIVQDRAASVGGALDSYTLFRTPDMSGEPRFLLEMVDKEGAIRTQYITGSDLRNYKPKPPLIQIKVDPAAAQNTRNQQAKDYNAALSSASQGLDFSK